VDENEDEGGSGTAVSELGGSRRFSVRRLRLPRARASARVERGRQQGGRRWARLLYRGRGAGEDAPTTRGGRDGGSTLTGRGTREVGDGVDKWAQAVRGE